MFAEEFEKTAGEKSKETAKGAGKGALSGAVTGGMLGAALGAVDRKSAAAGKTRSGKTRRTFSHGLNKKEQALLGAMMLAPVGLAAGSVAGGIRGYFKGKKKERQ